MTAHLRRPARELLAGTLLLVLVACGSTASTAAAPPDDYPESADELPLAEDRIRYQVNRADPSVVEVAIPDGGHVGWHPAYIGVTVARDTFEVLDMYSSFWF